MGGRKKEMGWVEINLNKEKDRQEQVPHAAAPAVPAAVPLAVPAAVPGSPHPQASTIHHHLLVHI